MKKEMDLKTWVVWSLRKASYRWPPRNAALRASACTKEQYAKAPGEKVSKLVRNFYRCKGCALVFSRKGVSIDHIKPVVDPRKGFQGFDAYIERMFVQVGGFQILCNGCHDKKTKKENRSRKVNKGK
jgi:5-methylcytosine-specific restriction endonuclease McrA